MIYRATAFPPAWVRTPENVRSLASVDSAQNYSSVEEAGDMYTFRPGVYADRYGRWLSVFGSSGDVVVGVEVSLPLPRGASGARVTRYAVMTASLLHANTPGSWADFSYRAWMIVGAYPIGSEVEPCELSVKLASQRVDANTIFSNNTLVEPGSDGLIRALGKGHGLSWSDVGSRGKHLDWVAGDSGREPARGVAVPNGSFHVGVRVGRGRHPLMESRLFGVEVVYEAE